VSRSNPHENGATNPAVRWFEWNGETGAVRYYDKDAKKNVDVGADFSFVLLDQLGGVRGWHEATSSGIYSNEVKDTRQDVLIVRAFKGGTLAEGLYKDIKDRVSAVGGQFVSNCYIGFKHDGGKLAIGALRFKGAALGAWMEFTKAHRADLFTKGIRITGYTEGKKGRITYRMPVLKLVELTEASNAAAVALDVTLQEFLSVYLKKTKRDQVDAVATHVRDEDMGGDADEPPPLSDDDIPSGPVIEDDIPFARMGGW
jgi:hypothetical protein